MQKHFLWLGVCALIFGCKSEAKDEPTANHITQAVCAEDCTPYACDETWGECYTSCRTDAYDCARGHVDERCKGNTVIR